ncbi:3-hydroxyacyl-[acyl-carrier-protein] dehydratase FabZ [Clostridium tetani]|uniref:3-hydroxyacyl-[acyl-carrier-protein] dehydratase FabZ n=1 Tax=Clostridium tetani (strain Massachusetts / E88) TaxID=212717 RepID=FABZ_CLOTE|nr:3-hydroxyacyl-ACP dehydratase FabZ [Clostridium tetani]Q899N7.1 RecName: Full=3-hydroxyacyl-[acyl-carrier-protein] dehydratase FabZ; AltName: Full=(3R)-hydroxymyristoyl-[acyl-carrier-protein] dehydratase; Short=(3R)-hydroxymyristoyl-ACP dehydrase; AltName: Full=Beta-hydroxyacyl-ACP dehydratase [Clostridium tetani E88]AAO34785.1 (3R)-hydroxymyristoyl-[acyl carrier protein] dehydratase [Clostridium tetani E88]KGI38840.1 3-hydroxyacyl-ACP dehydratase [Clostridium tetani ATCC 9441]KGI41288.1 3-h
MENLCIKDILQILPHRYPMLLIDKVETVEPGKKIVAYKNVTFNEGFFRGHFPHEPVMPGVLIIEALAQAGAIAVLSLDEFKGKIPYFAGINKAKFRKKVIPGDTLKLEVEMIKLRGSAGIGKGIAKVNEKVVAEAEIMFMIG